MKTIWNVLSVIAVANLLALAGFVGWLRSTDRLDTGRAREIRSLLTRTIAQQKADEEAQANKVRAEQAAAELAAREGRPPLTASDQLHARIEASEIDRQRSDRMKREVENLRAQLALERTRLDADRAELESDRKAFAAMAQADQQRLNDAQFQKTLSVLTSLKPPQAVATLQAIIESDVAAVPAEQPLAANVSTAGPTPQSGRRGPGFQQAVVYLDAMDERPRGKIIAEFLKTDAKLAADLLEQLRTRAQFARVQ